MGDFNATINGVLDRSTPAPSSRMASHLDHFLQQLKVVDIWREQHPGIQDFTHYSHRHQVYTLIDMIWVSQNIAVNVSSSTIGNILISDHSPVTILWRQPVPPPGQRNWRLNTFLLENIGIEEILETEIDVFFVHNEGSASLEVVWEAFKAFIRGVLISPKKYRDRYRQATDDLRSDIIRLDQQHKHFGNQILLAELNAKKNQLELVATSQSVKEIMCSNSLC